MTHLASPQYWRCYNSLPDSTRVQANHSFDLLKSDPDNPLLHLTKVDRYWSVRLDPRHVALAVEAVDGLLWFWIGTHVDYDQFVG